MAVDVLGGDGQQGAVEAGKQGEEGSDGVELGGGDVAEVHRVKHQQHVLAAHRGEAHLAIEGFVKDESASKNISGRVMVDDLLLLVVKHRVESEIRSTISRKEGGGSQKMRHRSHV